MKIKTYHDNRDAKVKLRYWDVRDANYTLAQVILPVLKEFREFLDHGQPAIDMEDLPTSNLRAMYEGYRMGGIDQPEAWQWVVDEMIYGFQEAVDSHVDDSTVRGRNGLRLFAKYFGALWQ